MLTHYTLFDTVLLMLTERKTVAELKEHKICPARMVETVMPTTRLALVSLAYAPGGALHPVNKMGIRVTGRDRLRRASGEGKGVKGAPLDLMLWRQKTLHGMPAPHDSREGLIGDLWPRLVNTNERRLHTGQGLFKREGNPLKKCLGGLSLASGSPTG